MHGQWCFLQWVFWDLQQTWLLHPLGLLPGWWLPRPHQTDEGKNVSFVTTAYQNINAHNTAMANYRSSLIIQGTNVLRRLQQFVTTESPWILGFFTTAYLISKSQQHPQKSGQMHLPGWKLSATRVVCSVEGSSTVYNEQCVPTRKKNSLSKSPPFPTTLSFYVFHIFHFSSFGDWGLLLICSPGCSEIYDPRVSVSQLPG